MAAVFRCYPRLLPRDERYNCHECTDESCEFWADYNLVDDEEMTYEEIKDYCKKNNIDAKILDPDRVEFFNATCERYRKG